MSQLNELREIILGENSEQLSELKERVEDIDARTRDVAEVLPPAIKASIEQSSTLVEALESPVSESLKRAIRREPREYAEILYPVMSPAIRRAIASAISSMFDTINQTIESATTVQGVKARFDAMRTGVPYAELALRRTLLYRVEHVYLIERETGLLISELQNSDVQLVDSDAVSAMFSAIQSFVQDSFSKNESDRLTNFTVGEHNVWVVHGPKAMLACVIRGQAPASLREDLYDVLDSIRTDFAQQIDDFNGDNSQFEGIQDYLGPCLQLQLKEEQRDKSISPVTWLLMIGLLSALAYFGYGWWQKQQQSERLNALLQQSPGYVLTDMQWQDGRLHVRGLQDPFAQLDQAQVETQNIVLENIEWHMKPFVSLEPEVVIRRFRHETDMPDSVNAIMNGNVMHIDGTVSARWLFESEQLLSASSTIADVDTTGITLAPDSLQAYFVQEMALADDTAIEMKANELIVTGNVSSEQKKYFEQLASDSHYVKKLSFRKNIGAEIEMLIARINATVVIFSAGANLALESREKLSQLITDLKELSSLLTDKQAIAITITGHADNSTGTYQLNQAMRLKRANAIADQLTSKLQGVVVDLNPVAAMPETQEPTRSAHINAAITAQ